METRKMKSRILFSLVMFVIMATSAMATDRHVPTEYPNIEDAVNASAPSGDRIIIAPGTYKGYYSGDWHAPIDPQGKNIIFIGSGTGETILDGRAMPEPDAYYYYPCVKLEADDEAEVTDMTILCGIDPCPGQGQLIGIDEGSVYCDNAKLTLRRCEFLGGCKDEEKPSFVDTRAIYCKDSGMLIKDCTVSIGNLGGGGADIYINGTSDVNVDGCTISGNSMYYLTGMQGTIEDEGDGDLTVKGCTISDNDAAGIYKNDFGNLTVKGCTISNNVDTGVHCGYACVTITNCTIDGGGLYKGLELKDSSGDINVTNSTIRNCSAPYGAGIEISGHAAVMIDGCTVTDNISTDDWGSIFILYCASGIINDCTITGNEAKRGGGISLYPNAKNVSISNCDISNNTANNCFGGGIYNGAGTGGSVTNVTHCKIKGNKALGQDAMGGGIYAQGKTNIINCQITKNEADIENGGEGGGIYLNGYNSKILNSTIADNKAGVYGGAVLYSGNIYNSIFWGNNKNPSVAEQQIYSDRPSDINISHCDIQHTYTNNGYVYDDSDGQIGIDIDPGSNKDEDPLFALDYHLSLGSPCIDEGNNSLVPLDEFDLDNDGDVTEKIPYDIDYQPRIMGCFVDIGADEAVSGACDNPAPPMGENDRWYKLDENDGTTAYDSSASPQDGTLVNMDPVTDWVPGQIDGALDFDGKNDYVYIPSYEIDADDGGTISLWFKTSADFTENYGKMGYLISQNNAYYSYLTVAGNGNSGSYNIIGETDSQNDYFVSVEGAAPKGVWNHIAVSFDTTPEPESIRQAKTYLNGVLIDTREINNPSLTLTRIGGAAQEYFNGRIDDVRLYDSALLREKIEQIYWVGRGNKAFSPNPGNGATVVDPDTVLSWSQSGYALSHDVYFGTDFDDVNDADTSSQEYKDTVYVNSFDPTPTGMLSENTTYYWRIDENVSDTETIKGDVWSFKTWSSNVVSHWTFDEGDGSTAYDSAGNNDGTVTGAEWTSGQIDGALSFDGNGDYVMVGDKDDLEKDEFTLSFWAQLDNPSGALQGGIAKGYIFGSATEFSYKMDFHSDYIWPGVTNTSNDSFGVTGSIGDSNWHMWTMTVGGGTLTLYKDGDYLNSVGYTGTIDYDKTNNNFVIGARDNGMYAFDGKIDDVRIYSRALSEEDVEDLYESGL